MTRKFFVLGGDTQTHSDGKSDRVTLQWNWARPSMWREGIIAADGWQRTAKEG